MNDDFTFWLLALVMKKILSRRLLCLHPKGGAFQFCCICSLYVGLLMLAQNGAHLVIRSPVVIHLAWEQHR